MPILSPTVLSTERLRLRWFREEDAAANFAVFSDPEVTRYWSRAPWTELEQSVQMIASTMANCADGSGLRFAIEPLAGGDIIGNVSLFHFVDDSRRCDIGYALASRHWGHGYVSEALRAVIDYGFRELALNRIEADVDPANAASRRVLEKLGFREEGYMPERWIVQGEPADTVNYGLLKRYWDARQGLSL